jgi:hypothetical protein
MFELLAQSGTWSVFRKRPGPVVPDRLAPPPPALPALVPAPPVPAAKALPPAAASRKLTAPSPRR